MRDDFLPLLEHASRKRRTLDLNHFACHGAWTTLMIRAAGAACPCYVFEVGNVREQPLEDIWNGTAMRECRRQLQTRLFPPCQGCCYLHHRTRMARGMAQYSLGHSSVRRDRL